MLVDMCKFVFIVAVVVLTFAGSTVGVRSQQEPGRFITQITQEDMALLLEETPFTQLQQFAGNAKTRQDALRNMLELLSVAVEAKRLGLAGRPEVTQQLEFMRALAIAQAYDAAHRKGTQKPSFAFIKQEEIDSFLRQPEIDPKFDNFIIFAQAGKILPEGDLPDEQKTRLKQDWAKILLTEKLAIGEKFDLNRKTNLQITLQQASLLSALYTREKLIIETKATNAEVANYVAKHPEYDVTPLRAKAEMLLRRARAGERFSKLAREYTDDPGSKETGGFYDWFGRGRMVKQFEDASFKLRRGQISGLVETQFGFHIIKSLGERSFMNRETGKYEPQVRIRHILVSIMAPADPENPLAPQLSLKDKAKANVETDKRDRLIDALILRNGVTVPADFTVPTPPDPKSAPQLPPAETVAPEPK